MSRVGRHVRDARRARGLSPQALAKLVGYENANKGARRVTAFEATGRAHRDLIDNVVIALGLDPHEVERLATMDREEVVAAFDEWLAASVEPELFLLPMLAVRWRVALPDGIKGDREKAAAYALSLAREKGMRASLVWSRRWTFSVWFAKSSTGVANDGEVRPELEGGWIESTRDHPNAYARLGRRPVTLTFE